MSGTVLGIKVNGQEYFLSPGQTLEELLIATNTSSGAVVAELNGHIIPAADFSTTALQPGDCLELVHFVGGG